MPLDLKSIKLSARRWIYTRRLFAFLRAQRRGHYAQAEYARVCGKSCELTKSSVRRGVIPAIRPYELRRADNELNLRRLGLPSSYVDYEKGVFWVKIQLCRLGNLRFILEKCSQKPLITSAAIAATLAPAICLPTSPAVLFPVSARPKFRRSDIATRTKKRGGAVLADELRGVWIDRIGTALVRINFYRFVFGGARLANRLTLVCSKALQDFLRA